MIKGSLYFNKKKTFFTNVKLQNGLKSVLLFFSAALRVDCEPRYRVIIDGVMSQAESH